MGNENIKSCIVGIVLLLVIGIWLAVSANPNANAESIGTPSVGGLETVGEKEKPAEQVFKNIQVFKGLPASQLRPAMSFIAGSLGVSCEYCHINPWESDAKPTKKTAREMVLMMRRINRENFGSRVVINCATCHRGRTLPVFVPPLDPVSLPKEKGGLDESETSPAPTVEQIFDRYIKSLGGKAALDKLLTRIVKMSEVSTDGSTATVQLYAKAPNQMMSITTANPPTKSIYVQTFPGDKTAWGQVNRGRAVELQGLDLSQVTRDAEFYKGLTYFRREYSSITFKGKETDGGVEVYVVEGRNSKDFRERLFFDVNTGLLVGRYGELKTVLGALPFQVDYEDYREIDGIKLPYTIRWRLPSSGWTDTITEIKHNVPIDDAKFVKPSQLTKESN